MSSATLSKERKIGNSDWAALPQHLLDSVSEKLVSAVDYLRFSVVCMSWYHVAKHNYKSARDNMSGPMMLLISSDEEDTWNLYNAMEGKVLDMQVRLPSKRFCGSSKGWLVTVEENYYVTLLNPFYRIKGMADQENSIIRLPPITPPDWYRARLSCEYFIHKATISADPILDADKCIVVVIYEDRCQLAFIRLKDTEWTYLDKRWYPVREVVHHDENNFYAVENSGQLLSFEITRESNSDVTLTAKGLPREYVQRNYLLHSDDGGLLMVQRIMGWEGKLVTTKFKIFELNSENCKWTEKTTLGNSALFLGDNSSVSVLASTFPECQPNCIYFNQDNNDMGRAIGSCGPHDFGVYNVRSQKISKPYTANAMTLLKKTKLHPIWVVPTIFL